METTDVKSFVLTSQTLYAQGENDSCNNILRFKGSLQWRRYTGRGNRTKNTLTPLFQSVYGLEATETTRTDPLPGSARPRHAIRINYICDLDQILKEIETELTAGVLEEKKR